MCISGACTNSSLASSFSCPFDDDYVIINSTLKLTCSQYFTELESKSRSVIQFCLSSYGQSKCCLSCLSKFNSKTILKYFSRSAVYCILF